MKWYTAIGCKGEDGEGRLLVKTDNQEKVLTEMETMLWAALTWTICAENRIYSQMYRVLCITFGKERATEWADEEDFLFCLRRLKKRGLVGVLPLPEQPENKSGVVLIRVTVDASGRVTSAAYEPKGSTTSDVELVAEARKAALRTRFTESRTVIEGGVITYIFKLTAE